MIGKITKGTGFKGLQSYLFNGKAGAPHSDRVAWVETRELAGIDPALSAAVMRATARESLRVERPVWHLSISLGPGEVLDREAWRGVIDRTLQDLGLEEHQVLIVAHGDTGHEHVHLMVNRVHPETGKAWGIEHDYARVERALRHRERELGLREVPGRHFALDGQERHTGVDLSPGERREAERTGRQPFSDYVREVAGKDMREARSWGELHERLNEVGLHLEKRARGVVLSDGERRAKASYVDRGSSLKGLEKRLGPWQPPARELKPKVRFRDVVELREVGREVARQEHEGRQARWEAHRAGEEAKRLEAQSKAAEKVFERHFRETFRDPAAARRAFDALAKERGAEAAARRLEREPQQLGKLRGRGGPLASAERWAAREAAVEATRAMGQVQSLRHGLHKARRALDAIERRHQPTARVDLHKHASRLIERVGWTLASTALPTPAYLALRAALGVGRKAVEAVQETQREVGR